jgi:Raf kinase inhibitor-like YbhB/YbcL family protein
MHKRLRLLVLLALCLLALPLALLAQTGSRLTLSTSAFSPGGDIPEKFTCSGADLSPALTWSNVPLTTKTLALIVDDPDAPSGTFTHWVLYNQPPGAQGLQEGVPGTAQLPGGTLQGMNSAHSVGYHGPCPPPGKPHRYYFKLYALDSRLDLQSGANKSELEQAIQGHILAQAEYMGRFAR